MSSLDDLEPKVVEAARLMEMLSQPARLRILCSLVDGEHSVLQLAQLAGLSQPAMSHHLKKLREADLVETRRDAQTIYYSLKGKEARAVLETLHGLYCAPQPPNTQSAVKSADERKAAKA